MPKDDEYEVVLRYEALERLRELNSSDPDGQLHWLLDCLRFDLTSKPDHDTTDFLYRYRDGILTAWKAGFLVTYRSMEQWELEELAERRGRRVARRGFIVYDLVPAPFRPGPIPDS